MVFWNSARSRRASLVMIVPPISNCWLVSGLRLGLPLIVVPIGVMVTGRYGDEALLLRLAGQVEHAAPWAGRRPLV